MNLSSELLAGIFKDERLSSTSKILLQEIIKLISVDWTHVPNKHLKDKIGKSDSTINRLITQLVKCEYLERKTQMVPGINMLRKIRFLKLGITLRRQINEEQANLNCTYSLDNLKNDNSGIFINDLNHSFKSKSSHSIDNEDNISVNSNSSGSADLASNKQRNSDCIVISNNESLFKRKRSNIISFNTAQNCNIHDEANVNGKRH